MVCAPNVRVPTIDQRFHQRFVARVGASSPRKALELERASLAPPRREAELMQKLRRMPGKDRTVSTSFHERELWKVSTKWSTKLKESILPKTPKW